MTIPGETVDERHDQVIDRLICGGDYKKIAKDLGLDPRTVRAYLADDGFKAKLRAARAEQRKCDARRLASKRKEAIEVLGEIMNDKQAASSSRVAAASKILDISTKLDLEEVMVRMDRLEEILTSKGEES